MRGTVFCTSRTIWFVKLFLAPSSIISLIFLFVSSSVIAQDSNSAIRQFRRTVFRLQQEMLELKEAVDNQKKELKAQKEELALQVEFLTSENNKLKTKLLELDGLILQIEDRLESSAIVKVAKELENLRHFQQALILFNQSYYEDSEKLLLDIVNQPGTDLPKDLLILILAQQKWKTERYEDALSYYSTLLAEFFGSPYFSQAIYEMSEVFADLGKPEQQTTLLQQLSALSETDKYSLLATQKLKEQGGEELIPVEAADATADVTSDTYPAFAEATTDTDRSLMDATVDTPLTSAEATSDTDGSLMDATVDSYPASAEATTDTDTALMDATIDTLPSFDEATAAIEKPFADVTTDSSEGEIVEPVLEADATADTGAVFKPVEKSADTTNDSGLPEIQSDAADTQEDDNLGVRTSHPIPAETDSTPEPPEEIQPAADPSQESNLKATEPKQLSDANAEAVSETDKKESETTDAQEGAEPSPVSTDQTEISGKQLNEPISPDDPALNEPATGIENGDTETSELQDSTEDTAF